MTNPLDPPTNLESAVAGGFFDIVERLHNEANVSEELHPGDSDIAVMREAADDIVQLRERLYLIRKENMALRSKIADFLNHEIAAAIGHLDEASELTRKKLRAHVREIIQTPHVD